MLKRGVEIVPGTLRDFTFVAANMRTSDWAEISAQVSNETSPLEVAAWSLSGREAWTAFYRDQPVLAFGVHDAIPSRNVLTIWAWGTKASPRVVPEVTRFIRHDCVPRWIDAGVTRVEARSDARHAEAHRWMRGLGAEESPCLAWGSNGEDFVLFHWTRESWHAARVAA